MLKSGSGKITLNNTSIPVWTNLGKILIARAQIANMDTVYGKPSMTICVPNPNKWNPILSRSTNWREQF
jgi:hypothetical protein